MTKRLFSLVFFISLLWSQNGYARIRPPIKNIRIDQTLKVQGSSQDSREIQEFLDRKKERETLELLKRYNESGLRRFETQFLITFPFAVIITFLSVRLYALLNAGNGRARMTRSHVATVVISSVFISGAVAYKGYSDYTQKREEIMERLYSQKSRDFETQYLAHLAGRPKRNIEASKENLYFFYLSSLVF